LKISRILHAGYLFESEATVIAFDPIFENPFSRNCFAFPDVHFDLSDIRRLKLNAVFISHIHDDHFSLDSLDLLDRTTPIYLYSSHPSLFLLISQLGFAQVSPLSVDESIRIGGFCITPRLALDPDIDSIFEIRAEGLRVLNVVDAWIDPSTIERLKAEAPWDLVLWPFQTMRELEVLSPSRAKPAPFGVPGEWIEQIQELRPRFLAPSSCQFVHEKWSWYNHALFPVSYRDFALQMKSAVPDCHVQRMDPSETFILTADSFRPGEALTWMTKVSGGGLASDDDYDYQPFKKIPSTAEIAQHFEPLNELQTRRVFDYCQTELLKTFEAVGRPNDPYFDERRIWRLSVYDHLGHRTDFNYLIVESVIKQVEASVEDLGWITEIPIAKFFAALETGESLTSMYMRINDDRFDSNVETSIHLANVLDDPLVRCLFSGAIGAYQIAQLKRLQPGQSLA
jgi:hypothetical protein